MSMLTAEQVREAIFNGSAYASYDGAKYYADGIHMQAIADELNTRAERTCHVKLNESKTAVICSNCGSTDLLKEWSTFKGWDGETRIDTFTTYPYCPNCGVKVADRKGGRAMECDTCKYYEDASRYDPNDDSELYTLTKCTLHGHVTDWPCACEDWEGVDE